MPAVQFCGIIASVAGAFLLLALKRSIILLVLSVLTAFAVLNIYRQLPFTLVRRNRAQRCSHFRTSKAEECLQLLRAKDLPSSSVIAPFQNALTPHQSRAAPNQRLVATFGIENCFVADQVAVCNAFRMQAIQRLILDDAKWRDMRKLLLLTLARESKSKDRTFLPVPRVRYVTLKLALPVLCCLGAEEHQDSCIRQMASEINKELIRSKGPSHDMMSASGNTRLRELLAQLFPQWKDQGFNPDTNPLNFVLLGYKTLWRVVLRCLVEVAFRGHGKSEKWLLVLGESVANPTLTQLYDTSIVESRVSASFIVKEALRLYPPTRRIYRTFLSEEGEVVEAAADVEASHRNEAVWGVDATIFNPAHWCTITEEEEKRNFLASGAAPFACIARSAPPATESKSMMPPGIAMIALLVGGMIVELCDGGWALDLAEMEVYTELKAGSTSPIKTNREAYAGLRVTVA